MNITHRSVVFRTPWFSLVAKSVDGEATPYYSLRTSDHVAVVAVTTDAQLLLVRQFRPAVEAYTLELPSGHVDADESPEEAAYRELLEETGHRAEKMELLGKLMPDTGRADNRLWCFFAPDVEPVAGEFSPEPGVETVQRPAEDLMEVVRNGDVSHALNVAALSLAALWQGYRFADGAASQTSDAGTDSVSFRSGSKSI